MVLCMAFLDLNNQRRDTLKIWPQRIAIHLILHIIDNDSTAVTITDRSLNKLSQAGEDLPVITAVTRSLGALGVQ